MIELSQLRCFTAVATELNFRRAAIRLNMTQPPLSRQIQLLEHQLGVRLLERSTRSVILTAAGRAFFVEAQYLLERAELAIQSARNTAYGSTGTVGITFIASAVYEFLPDVIVKAQQQYPGINISLKEMTTFEQVEAMRLRKTDIGIIRSSSWQNEFEHECLLREPFVLAMPDKHELADKPDITVQDLNGKPFIMYSLTSWQPFYELLAGMFRSAGVIPDYVQHINSTLTMLALVNAGLGAALVPRSASRIHFDHVMYRPIELDPGIRSELHLIWREDNENPASKVILQAIRESVSGVGRSGERSNL